MGRGPDGKTGVVFTVLKDDIVKTVGYHAERQTWTQMAERVWCGWTEGERPGPAELARAEQYNGHQVLLEDGNKWLVPRVKNLLGEAALPKGLTKDWETGEWKSGEVLPRYREVTAAVGDFWRAALGSAGDEGEPITVTVQGDLAARVIALNYHVGEYELLCLGALSDHSSAAVVLAAHDWPVIREVLKKNEESAGAGGLPGVED